jgi:hypothetical protein
MKRNKKEHDKIVRKKEPPSTLHKNLREHNGNKIGTPMGTVKDFLGTKKEPQ